MKCEICQSDTRINYGVANVVCSSCAGTDKANELINRSNMKAAKKPMQNHSIPIQGIDIAKLTQMLLWGGGAITFCAFLWWANFYGQVVKEFGGQLSEAATCLYSSSGTCALVSGLAQMGGGTPYDPVVFWVGIVVLGLGILLFLSATTKNRAN
ncbi:hypothetical protein [Shewanella atlantica]|uniref:hypothetical protein n=1 Tax=Shewanella atlantica TaxID=271099 RepID=UPI00373563BB